jgi:glucosamine 6-phosphate synthetase-like amidotransferase/phosphosugar isomerase protein
MLSSNVSNILETCNEKSKEIAASIKSCKHIFFCGEGLGDCIAREGALKMKEMTYLHCQNIKLDDIGNNFYNFFYNRTELIKSAIESGEEYSHLMSPIVFIILDQEKDKAERLEKIKDLKKELSLELIFVSDVKDSQLR